MTRIRDEVTWFLRNYALALVVSLTGWALYGISLVVSGEGIGGYRGSPVEQVLWYAVGSTFFTIATLGLPAFLALLVLWRAMSTASGKPKATGLLIVVPLLMASLCIAGMDGLQLVLLAVALPLGLFLLIAKPNPRRQPPDRRRQLDGQVHLR